MGRELPTPKGQTLMANYLATAEVDGVPYATAQADEALDALNLARTTMGALFPRLAPKALYKATAQTEMCFVCCSTHPASEGITHFLRAFECECGETWEDTWCSDCNDECPACGADCSPSELLEETVIVEGVN